MGIPTAILGRNAWFGCGYMNDRNRRVWLLAVRPREGLLTERTAGVQLARPEQLFMPPFATLATHDKSASSNAAFFRSAVSNPSVNQP